MKDVFAQVAEDALRFGAKKKIGEELGAGRMRRLTVDRDEAQGREIFAHPHIVDGPRILELIFDVADRHRRLPRWSTAGSSPTALSLAAVLASPIPPQP